MSKHEVMEQLLFVLSQKIYPIQPALIRNDTKAARIVANYVSTISQLNVNWWDAKSGRRSRLQNETLASSWKTETLKSLSDETIRKYIAELWREDAFADLISFRVVNDTD
jgi:hypothetical protein